MKINGFLLWCIIGVSSAENFRVNDNPFPTDFMFGVATAAHQIEGAWNADGKGENIWDYVIRVNPWFMLNKSNAEHACDSYNKYKQDVSMVKSLGVNYYRFSISWTRILPSGHADVVNPAGQQYYKNLIRTLKLYNIQPFVTLYHWDLPQSLQNTGGWANPFVVDIFVDYARICFQLYGEDVKHWITINEPKQVCHGGYGEGTYAPGIKSNGVAEYWCTHNILKAHAKVWHMYDEEFRPKQKGRISITVDSFWYEPASDSPEDKMAAQRHLQFALGWFLNPIFNGNYPKVMIDRIAMRSQTQGYNRSRLPQFTKDEMTFIKGTYDFLGFNFYTSVLTTARSERNFGSPSWQDDIGLGYFQPSTWLNSSMDWLKVTPWGFRKILVWIKENYNNPEIIITENGVPDFEPVNDKDRINYYKGHLSNLRDAMEIDKVNVTGYTAWSLMDNLEWADGYMQKFGLYHVDMSDPGRSRTRKDSADFFETVAKTHRIQGTYEMVPPKRSTFPSTSERSFNIINRRIPIDSAERDLGFVKKPKEMSSFMSIGRGIPVDSGERDLGFKKNP